MNWTLICVAGGIYDFLNFEEVQCNSATAQVVILKIHVFLKKLLVIIFC